MSYIKTISISEEFKKMAEDYQISWTEAARVGMGVILAEKGIREYNSSLNIVRKMNIFRVKAEEALQKISDQEELLKKLG